MGFGTAQVLENLLKHGHEDAESTVSLLHNSQGKSGKVLSSNILMYVEKPLLMEITQKLIWNTYDEPINSYDIHTWWTYMKNLMNPDEDHQEHNNILKFILKNTTTFWNSECLPIISSKSLWGPWYSSPFFTRFIFNYFLSCVCVRDVNGYPWVRVVWYLCGYLYRVIHGYLDTHEYPRVPMDFWYFLERKIQLLITYKIQLLKSIHNIFHSNFIIHTIIQKSGFLHNPKQSHHTIIDMILT